MADCDVVIRELDLERDAPRLAEMWNASDLQWPGLWTGGIPFTADLLHEWHVEEQMLAIYVAEVDGEIAGYCSFCESHDHKGEGYLELLNVHPKYQKRSIGRKLIQATIERSVQAKWQRQTLGTWSANFKAVPTYKKTGHFWTPDTSVWMQNYVPGALQMSLAEPFFARHPWYDCYVRDLDQAPDDQRWEGLKVFTEYWQADGESLTIWIDREARGPVAIETDQCQVAALVEELEPLAGSKAVLRWRVINKGAEPLQVVLHALGDKGLEIDHRAVYTVPAGQTVVRQAEVAVADDAPPGKDDGSAHAVRSIIRLNDQEIELFSGLRPRRPWRLDTWPAEITLRPAVPQTIKLQLHSELEQELPFTLHLTPPEGLTVDQTTLRGTLPAKGHLALPITLTAAHEGVFTLPLVGVATGDGAPKPLKEALPLFCLGAGGVLAGRQGDNVRLETDALRLKVEGKQATLTVFDKAQGQQLGSIRPMLGKPFWPSVFHDKVFAIDVREPGGRAVLTMQSEAHRYDGLWLHQQLSLSAAGVIELEYWLENRGHKPQSVVLRLDVGSSSREAEWQTVPLVGGLVQCRPSTYPTGWQDLPREASAWREPWMAWERRGAVMGLAWDEHCQRIEKNWGTNVTCGELTVEPGRRSEHVRLALVAGRGDWRLVQQLAADWRGQPAVAEGPRPPVLAALQQAVLATVDDQVSAALQVDSLMRRTVTADYAVESATLGVSEGTGRAEVNRDQVHQEAIQLTVPAKPGVHSGVVRLTSPQWSSERAFSVVRLGDRRPVQVSQETRGGHPVWTIDNGRARLAVCLDYGPSLIAWDTANGNQLWSLFPGRAGFSWSHPYFGGLHATLVPVGAEYWEGVLHQEAVSAQAIEARDAQGIAWQGVRLSADLAKKELQGLRVELDYLTVGGSPLLKWVYRLRNLRPTAAQAQLITHACFALGADPTQLTAHADGLRREPSVLPARMAEYPWVAVSNAQNGRTALMACRQERLSLWDAGQYGRVLGSEPLVKVQGDETVEIAYYLVIAETLDEALAYRALCDYQG
jgi:GNAT superfamily N-acetyltransferase